MQDYLEKEQIDCNRPLYNDVVKKKVDTRFNKAFSDAPDIVTKMKESRKKNSNIVTMGLWPLDVVSYHDWRSSTHTNKIFPEYVTMARIEIQLVGEYRASMFKECQASAYIRMGLASALAEACKATARFIYIDKVPCKGPSVSEAPKVNVVDLKKSRERVARSEIMVAEAVSLLKKIENLKGSAAAPGSKMIDHGVADAVTKLRRVCCL